MTDIIFCRTDFDYIHPENGYGSYRDFFKLAELSGFPIIKVQELDPDSDNVYVITPVNGEWKHGWQNPRARLIHWNLEQGGYEPIPGLSETWVSDARLAEVTGAKYVMMGSHPKLAGYEMKGHMIIRQDGVAVFDKDTLDWTSWMETGERERLYDVITLSYNTPRRIAILEQLIQRGIRCAPNGWNKERHETLMASAAMLHVHQNEGKNYVAPQRFALAAAYRLPVITETLDHRNGFGAGHILMSDYANLPEFVRNKVLRDDPHMLTDYGWSLHNLLCIRNNFRTCVEGAL